MPFKSNSSLSVRLLSTEGQQEKTLPPLTSKVAKIHLRKCISSRGKRAGRLDCVDPEHRGKDLNIPSRPLAGVVAHTERAYNSSALFDAHTAWSVARALGRVKQSSGGEKVTQRPVHN